MDYLNIDCVYNKVKYIFTIGDIHGDYEVFKNTILNIGRNYKIFNDKGNYSNIFNIYKKRLFNLEFELCSINKEAIKEDNFLIVQLGDIIYSAFENVQNKENEEIKLMIFIFSLFNSFTTLNKEFNLRCRYIQLLGNHDILILSSPRESNLFNDLIYLTKQERQNNYCNYKDYLNCKFNVHEIKKTLLRIGLIFCKINNILYTHCFFNNDTLRYIYNESVNSEYFKTNIQKDLLNNKFRSFQNILIETYNYIFKSWIINFYSLNLTVDEVYKKIFKNKLKYIASELVHNNVKEKEIITQLKLFFGCDKIIIGHVFNKNFTYYCNGLIKNLDIGISRKMINKHHINRKFKIFYSYQSFNNLPLYYINNEYLIYKKEEFKLIYY